MYKSYTQKQIKCEDAKAIEIFINHFPLQTKQPLISDWGEANRILPQGTTPQPGPFRYAECEPLREIVDCLSPSSPVRELAFMKGTQLGATTAVSEMWIGYTIAVEPGPMLAITGDASMAEGWMEKRIDPMIDSCNLRHKIYSQIEKANNRNSGDTKNTKSFPGGFLDVIGPKTESKLRSNAIQFLILEEEDAYPQEIKDAGDPSIIARRRTDRFETTRKILHISTPLVEGTSRIKAAYLLGDQRKYFVPCKMCGQYQALEFGQLTWQVNEKGNLDYNSVRYICKFCNAKWTNSDKAIFLSRGKGHWRPTAVAQKKDYRSYHLSALYSSVGGRSWESIVEEWLDIKEDRRKLRAFVNTVLAETWQERGEAPKWERIMLRNRGKYTSGNLPQNHEALVVTVGADIQKDRIECEVVAWGESKISWSLGYYVLYGDTSSEQSTAWKDLKAIIEKEHEGLTVAMALIDAGYHTSQVYAFCEQYVSGVYAVMSEPTNSYGKNIFTLRDVTGYATKRVNIQSGQLKSELYGYLYKEKEDEQLTGYCLFPEDYPEEYFKQLTAEVFMQEKCKNGYIKSSWVKTRDRNEALDCRIYALAALYVFVATVQGAYEQNEPISWPDFWKIMKNN